MTIVLASTSPRRRDLLARLGLPFTVIPSAVVERSPHAGEPPVDYASALAREKAASVGRRMPNDVVIGADTVVVVDDLILGKPVDALDAERMLMLLAGRCHEVITAVALDGAARQAGHMVAQVCMRRYNPVEVRRYVETGEPMDKAGAYAVQEYGGNLVANVVGCYETVVGLPLCLTQGLLRQSGSFDAVPAQLCCTHYPGPMR